VLWKDKDRGVLETDGTQWDRVMGINLKSVFWVTKHGIPHLRAAGGGSIILIGSVSALGRLHAGPGRLYRGKGGLISLNKSLAIQFAKDGIRSNVIIRGSSRPRCKPPTSPTSCGPSSKTGIPLGRIGQPRDIAYAALFLASDESSFMTGAEMIVDGGFMAQ